MSWSFKLFIIYRVCNRIVLLKQNHSIFLMKSEFGNSSLLFIFRFPFLSLLSEYNTEKHSPGFHSCLPPWPDELGKGQTSASSPGPAVKPGCSGLPTLAALSKGAEQTHPPPAQLVALLCPSGALTPEVRNCCDLLMFLQLGKLLLFFQTFASGSCTSQAFLEELNYPANTFAAFC